MLQRRALVLILAGLLFTLVCGDIAPTAGAGEPVVAEPPGKQKMNYVEPTEQLVVELYVRNVRESAAFYEKLGFKAIRREATFVELGWENSLLFLEQLPGQPAPPVTLVANIRIMVADVDRYWKVCQEMHLPVKKPIGDRYYGLRDFTVMSPDGVGLRFASKLPTKPPK
jgi:catechol 2,3-dioxygenase-like lactoylglutathione lyase family enzyme